jgi:hypothetical protein
MIDLSKKAYTWVSETFAPQAGKNFPVTEQRFVLGGHQNFGSLAARNAFPMERRAKHMTCTVRDVSYILDTDLQTWRPFDRGYLVLNPKKAREAFYLVLPFRFAVLGITSVNAVVHTAPESGLAGEKKTVELSGAEGSVVTLEIARIHVD